MSAAASCATGGACAVGPRVTDAIRGMREKDGRCIGCGRKVDAAQSNPAEKTRCANCGGEVSTVHPHRAGECLAPAAVAVEVGAARDLAARSSIADDALRATSAEGLVDTVIRLTHQIAGLIASSKPDADERARELRLQRSMVKLEIVRRAS